MRVLIVCTANICRSPSAEWALRDAAAAHPVLAGLEVRSAGTAAVEGAAGCRVAPALAGRWAGHRSRLLDEGLVAWADLILTAAREHGAAVAALDPRARARTMALRQAGRSADWLVEAGMVEAAMGAGDGLSDAYLDLRMAVPDMPAARAERWRWVVGELDAARGLAARPSDEGESAEPPGGRWGRRWRRGAQQPGAGAWTADDIPDPHVLGRELHEAADSQITEAVGSLVRLFAAVHAEPVG